MCVRVMCAVGDSESVHVRGNMCICEWDMKCIDVLAIGCSEYIQGRHTHNTISSCTNSAGKIVK